VAVIGIMSGCTDRHTGPDAKDELGRRFVSKRLKLPKGRSVRPSRSGSGVVQCCPRAKRKRKRKRKSGGKMRERRDGMGLQQKALTFRLALVVEGVAAGLVSTIKD
jgi:hypothetical protein